MKRFSRNDVFKLFIVFDNYLKKALFVLADSLKIKTLFCHVVEWFFYAFHFWRKQFYLCWGLKMERYILKFDWLVATDKKNKEFYHSSSIDTMIKHTFLALDRTIQINRRYKNLNLNIFIYYPTQCNFNNTVWSVHRSQPRVSRHLNL